MKRGEVTPGSARALVTGAGSGIGRCYALRLAALGYDLVLAGNRREPLEAVAAEIRAAADRCDVRIVEIDLARAEAAAELWEAVRREGVTVDILINNAGIFSFRDILATPPERIERILLLHTLTNTQLCRLAAADMVRRGCRGYILNMSSYSLWMPFPGLSLYSASKAYLRSFSVAFAKEVREHGIRVKIAVGQKTVHAVEHAVTAVNPFVVVAFGFEYAAQTVQFFAARQAEDGQTGKRGQRKVYRFNGARAVASGGVSVWKIKALFGQLLQ